jgi:N-methylhydantoinase A
VLVPSGGGGALHAGAIARELSVPRLLIPPMPAHFSALGMLLADLKHDYVQTLVRELLDISGPDLADSFAALENSATRTLADEGADRSRIVLRRFLDMRYRGQEYTLPVPVSEDLRALQNFDAIRGRFDQLHQEHYGHSAPGEPVMIVNLRLSALGKFDNPLSLTSEFHGGDTGQRGSRPVMFDDAKSPVTCPIFLRAGLEPGARLAGPAVIEEIGATILLYPGDAMTVNEFGHIVIDVAH